MAETITKSEAVRILAAELPDATATTIISTAKSRFGLDISQPLVYALKAKMRAKGASAAAGSSKRGTRVRKPATAVGQSAAPSSVVETIEAGRRLLTLTGSVEDATAVLKAL